MFVMILLIGRNQKVNGVRESCVRNVVQKAGYAFLLSGPKPLQENIDPKAVLKPADGFERENQGGWARLFHTAQACHGRRLDEILQRWILDCDKPINAIYPLNHDVFETSLIKVRIGTTLFIVRGFRKKIKAYSFPQIEVGSRIGFCNPLYLSHHAT